MSSRPLEPRWRRGFDVIGRILLSTGLLLLLFTGYQLWGTGIAEFRSQKALEKTFEARRAPTPQYSVPKNGEVAGRITIDAIGLSKILVAGVDYRNLERGPGIFPGSPLPGHLGNLAIAGHRTTYGAPFARLNELKTGDPIQIETVEGSFTYVVKSSPRIVAATDVQVAQTFDPNATTLTLITCHPKWTSKKRLIVEATISVEAPSQPTVTYPIAPNPAVQLTRGWFDDSDAWPVVCGLLSALLSIALACRLLIRRFRRKFVVYTASLIVFLPTLFVFYSQVSRLLPSNL
jgi:sortase A